MFIVETWLYAGRRLRSQGGTRFGSAAVKHAKVAALRWHTSSFQSDVAASASEWRATTRWRSQLQLKSPVRRLYSSPSFFAFFLFSVRTGGSFIGQLGSSTRAMVINDSARATRSVRFAARFLVSP